MSETIRLPKTMNLSKEDPLNRPRHQIQLTCHTFEECPLCYKCRSYDPSQIACLNCTLWSQALLCNRQKHTPSIIERMISREIIEVRYDVP